MNYQIRKKVNFVKLTFKFVWFGAVSDSSFSYSSPRSGERYSPYG